jgi:hypothetical protein
MKSLVVSIMMLVSINLYGQWVPHTTTMQTPYGPARVTSYTYSPMHQHYNNWNSNFRRNKGSDLAHSVSYKFNITYANDSSVWVTGKLDFYKTYFLGVTSPSEKAVTPKQTKSIYRITKTGRKLIGIATDSSWLFRIGEGKINCYAILAEEDLSFTVAVQEGEEGVILPLNAEVLTEIMKETPALINLIERRRYMQAIHAYNNMN